MPVPPIIALPTWACRRRVGEVTIWTDLLMLHCLGSFLPFVAGACACRLPHHYRTWGWTRDSVSRRPHGLSASAFSSPVVHAMQQADAGGAWRVLYVGGWGLAVT